MCIRDRSREKRAGCSLFYSYICLVKLDVGHRQEGCANKVSFLFFKLEKFRISTQSGFEPPTFGVGHRER